MNQELDPTQEPKNQDYDLSIENHEGYLEVHIRGKRTLEMVSFLAAEIARVCLEVHCSKILVDAREFEGFLGVYDSYHVVTRDFPKLRGKGIQKVAFIDRVVPGMRGWFFETVAVNRAFNLRVFADRKLALDWLLGKPQLDGD